jgi:hypothetical protein
MKKWNVILGVDVSKLTLDICCAERNAHLWFNKDSFLVNIAIVVMGGLGGVRN